jgi:hypothetical protein
VEPAVDGAGAVASGEVVAELDDDPPSESPVEDPVSPLRAAESPEPDDEDADARRSFFAQPVPLKWTAGAAKALRTGPPPHDGQLVGPSAWTPWMTSNRVPQLAQS